MNSDNPQSYIPEQGDIIWINFMPQAGREQTGRRPSLVISRSQYNRRVRLALVCPITSKIKNYPLEVLLPKGLPVSGVILADQVKSLDWTIRQAEFICKAPSDVTNQVIITLRTLTPLQ